MNLERCKRYYQLFDDGAATSAITLGTSYNTTTVYTVVPLHPEMRTQPSIDQVTGTNYYDYLSNGSSHNFDSFGGSTGNSTNKFMRLNTSPDISTTAGYSGWIKSLSSSAYLAFDAEL